MVVTGEPAGPAVRVPHTWRCPRQWATAAFIARLPFSTVTVVAPSELARSRRRRTAPVSWLSSMVSVRRVSLSVPASNRKKKENTSGAPLACSGRRNDTVISPSYWLGSVGTGRARLALLLLLRTTYPTGKMLVTSPGGGVAATSASVRTWRAAG